MDAATVNRPANPPLFLTGMQAGMIAACWMLLWMGISSMWIGRSFWSAENIMATALSGERAIRPSFAATTPAGIALYLIIYSLLGSVFAVLVKDRLTGLGRLLFGVLFGLVWYYLWFRVLALRAMPLVWLLHTEKPTEFAHVIFGVLVALPNYRREGPSPIVEAPADAASTPVAAVAEEGAHDPQTP
jgi:hypothetical protein